MNYKPVEYVGELMNLTREYGTDVKIRARIEDLGIPAEKFRKINDPEDLRKILEESRDYLRDGDHLQLTILTRAPYGEPKWVLCLVNYKWENGKWRLVSETFPTEDYGGFNPGYLDGVPEDSEWKVRELIKNYGTEIKPGTDMGALKPLVEDW